MRFRGPPGLHDRYGEGQDVPTHDRYGERESYACRSSASACSSQNGMTIVRYIVTAVVKAAPAFGRYQERTRRTIPVVELLPAK